MFKRFIRGLLGLYFALLLCGGKSVPELCFENMPPPQNASFSPICTTMPLALPLQEARLTSPFGYRYHPISGQLDFHYGLDLAAPEKTMIFAAVGGIVQVADTHDSYGNYLVIDHYNGFSTLYAHCSKLLVQKGDLVGRGEKIALVGHTGEATGDHLHFEIRLHGIRYDPLWILGDGEKLTLIPEPELAQTTD